MFHKIRIVVFSVFSVVNLLLGNMAIGEDIRCQQRKNSYLVSRGDRPLFEYRYGQVSMKPYVERLYTPSGVNILRDSPADHIHHHALMFAVRADGCDFWTEYQPETRGRQKTISVGPTPPNATGGIQSRLTWIKPDGAAALSEERTVRAVVASEDVTLISWMSTFAVPDGREKITIDGSHYFGLGLRFVQSMDKGGRFFNSEGAAGPVFRGDERITPCRWCAYTAKVDGRPVTVALLDRPANPRGMHVFTMGDAGSHFAYLSATMNYHKESLEITAGQPMTIGYGVAVWDGEKTADQVDVVSRQWLKMQGE